MAEPRFVNMADSPVMVFNSNRRTVTILPWRERNLHTGLFLVEGEHYRQFPSQLQEMKEPAPGASFPERVQVLGADGSLRSLASGAHQVEGDSVVVASLRSGRAEVAHPRPAQVPLAHDRSYPVPPPFAARMVPPAGAPADPAGVAGGGVAVVPEAPRAEAEAAGEAEAEGVAESGDEDPAASNPVVGAETEPRPGDVRTRFRRR